MLFPRNLILITVALIIQLGSYSVTAAPDDDCLSCMYCEKLDEESSYSEGIMKSMKNIVIGRNNWLFRSDVDLSTDFGIPNNFKSEFNRLVSELNKKGIELVVMLQPTRGLIHRDQVAEKSHYSDVLALKNFIAFERQLIASGSVVPEMHFLLEGEKLDRDYFFRRDHHWTPFGARISAKIVADKIKSIPLYKSLKIKKFSTEQGVLIPKDGTMNRALMRLCGNNFGSQYVQGFSTYSEDTSEDALFGDEVTPEIVLVGTSNSAQRDDDRKNYNFDGFLKDFLQVDVLNQSLPGGGQDGSFIQYLLNEYDMNNPPKVILWELPVSYALDDSLMYRQLIPAIKGGCNAASKDVTVSNSFELSEFKVKQRYELFKGKDLVQHNIRPNKYALELSLSDTSLKDFYVITYFENGERDKVWFRRYDIVDGGKYLLEMTKIPEHRENKITSIFIEPTEPSKAGTNVEATLCPLS